MPNLNDKARAVQLNTEGLLKLLGGSPDDRERFWEIVKGITRPAEFTLAESALDAAAQQLSAVRTSLAALHKVAQSEVKA